MDWRVARSLNTLLAQINALAPRRSKTSDGSIGDAAHATRTSDHNPWYVLGGTGVVTARDFTHDVAGGLDCHWLAARLVASGDKRIKYIIWSNRIWGPATGWRPYSGVNPHTHHLHLSVVASPLCDDTTPWRLAPPPKPAPALSILEDDVAYLVKGDLMPDVYIVSVSAGAPGGVIRTYLPDGPGWRLLQRLKTEVRVVPQAELDAIPKAAGSR